MARALAVLLTLLLAACLIVLLVALVAVVDLPLCSEPDAGRAQDCIEGTATERILGLACALAAVLCAGAGTWLGMRFARRGVDGRKLAIAVIATPLLAFAALWLLPVSF